MRRSTRRALSGLAAGALCVALYTPGVAASPPPDRGTAPAAAPRPDNRPGPLSARQEARRKAALEKIRSGKASPDEDGVVQLADDKYVQTAVTGTDQVLTILAQFGASGSGRLGTVPGPAHNEIEAPDRALDNTTLWEEDFSSAYYHDLFFGDGESFNDFYEKQSGGQYHLDGAVSDWVTVPGNASTYGDNAVEDFGGAWLFVEDTADAWYTAQLAEKTPTEIDDYLATFDVWDRYDFDEDGDFDEADGYLDHFQAIHAGEGEEAGGGAQGEDAIWSHRWYVNATDFGVTGPTVGTTQVKFGGTQIGASKYWIGDYTTEPENGGLGVFAHEYAHDLGLPDLYDTAGGDNGTGFWTLMSGGSWMNHGAPSIGDTPDHMGPWEKLQLGWLDYEIASPGENGEFTLSPAADPAAAGAQALIVDVPDQSIATDHNDPYSGSTEWWSGSADDLNVTLTRPLDLTGHTRATITAKAWYDIEAGYDYLYAEYSTNGTDWTQIGAPVDGSSKGHWTTLRYTVPGGQPTQFRFRYQTDGGVHLAGAFLDDITVKDGGTTLFFDDVEGSENGWETEPGGWTRMDGTAVSSGDRYYLAEHRTYTGYDATLQVGPYNFSEAYERPDWAERFPYQDGMLVWAIDETYGDNNTSEHPGHGLALPVDARPTPVVFSDGFMLGNRRQPFDATFSLATDRTDAVTFHRQVLVGKGQAQQVDTLEAAVPSSDGIPTFDDTVAGRYWSEDNPLSSALVAGHGAQITITSRVGDVITVSVVNPAATSTP